MSDYKCSLLIVDDERSILSTLGVLLKKDYEVLTAPSSEEAVQILTQRDINIILCDQRLPGMSGVQLLEWVHDTRPKTMRLMMTGFADVDDAVQAINRGHVYRYLFKPWKLEELQQVLKDAAKFFILERDNSLLVDQLNKANAELESRVQQRTRELEEINRELQQKNTMLERLALTDELTGIANRRLVEQVLHAEVRRRRRYPSPLAVGYVDADHFKDINTRYFLSGGDLVLVALAKTLCASIRGVDTIGRTGGEEFLVVAPETDLDGAHGLGERIRSAVEQLEVNHQGQRIKITVSVGLAVAPADCYLTPEQLMHEAAVALDQAKCQGRNCVVVRVSEGEGSERELVGQA